MSCWVISVCSMSLSYAFTWGASVRTPTTDGEPAAVDLDLTSVFASISPLLTTLRPSSVPRWRLRRRLASWGRAKEPNILPLPRRDQFLRQGNPGPGAGRGEIEHRGDVGRLGNHPQVEEGPADHAGGDRRGSLAERAEPETSFDRRIGPGRFEDLAGGFLRQALEMIGVPAEEGRRADQRRPDVSPEPFLQHRDHFASHGHPHV